jgi:DnaJ-class molecular chaperone
LVILAIIDINPMPTIDQILSNIPKRIPWKKLKGIMRGLDFYDVLDHDGEDRITANLYATDDAPWNISMSRSVTVHVTFVREGRHVVSTGTIVMPNGTRGSEISFPSARDAIVAALKMCDHAQKNELHRVRGKGNAAFMEWGDEE